MPRRGPANGPAAPLSGRRLDLPGAGVMKLTPEIRAQILAGTRQGGHAYIAAQAAGAPLDVFKQWMRKGRKSRRSRNLYRVFYEEVQQAKGIARLLCETEVRK